MSDEYLAFISYLNKQQVLDLLQGFLFPSKNAKKSNFLREFIEFLFDLGLILAPAGSAVGPGSGMAIATALSFGAAGIISSRLLVREIPVLSSSIFGQQLTLIIIFLVFLIARYCLGWFSPMRVTNWEDYAADTGCTSEIITLFVLPIIFVVDFTIAARNILSVWTLVLYALVILLGILILGILLLPFAILLLVAVSYVLFHLMNLVMEVLGTSILFSVFEQLKNSFSTLWEKIFRLRFIATASFSTLIAVRQKLDNLCNDFREGHCLDSHTVLEAVMGLVRSAFESKTAAKRCAEVYEKCLEVKSH